MTNLPISMILIASSFGAQPGPRSDLPPDTPLLMLAIAHVESNLNHQAIGDNGKARGMFQIWESYWTDGTQHLNVSWDYLEGSFDIDKSAQVVIAYWTRYAPKNPTLEILARIHNGGPKGYQRQSTIAYWKKVETKFNDLKKQKERTK